MTYPLAAKQRGRLAKRPIPFSPVIRRREAMKRQEVANRWPLLTDQPGVSRLDSERPPMSGALDGEIRSVTLPA